MKSKLFIALCLTVILYSCATAVPRVAFSTDKPNNLYRVKKIYILTPGYAKEDWKPEDYQRLDEAVEREKRMNVYLERELVSIGFEVVKDKGNADAVLSGEIGFWMVFDGPPHNPTKHYYNFRLTPPALVNLWDDKQQYLWHTQIDVNSNAELELVDQKAAPKIVKKLFEAWQKSAKKAGINTGNKIQ